MLLVFKTKGWEREHERVKVFTKGVCVLQDQAGLTLK